jgi:sugar lactone lactonase YvrE
MKKFARPLPCCVLILSLCAALVARGAADYATPYVFTTLAGTSGIGSADGTGAAARFYSPRDIATDFAGNCYVLDEGNHTVRKVTPAGVVTTFAGTAGLPGSADGTGAAARFDAPQGIVADTAGNLFVADTGNHTIRKVTPAGVVTTFAGLAGVTGNTDGTGGAARFNRPRRLAIDTTGNLFVTEAGNRAIRKITPAGVVTTVATTLSAGFWFPESGDLSVSIPLSYGAIAVDTTGNLYVAHYQFVNYYTHAPTPGDNYAQYVGFVSRIAPDGTTTPLWQTSAYNYSDGRLNNGTVSALAFDPAPGGQLVVATSNALYRYNPTDSSLTVKAGDGTVGGADGPAASAKFGFPLALAYERTGTLYIADTGNNVVRKLSPAGAVTTIAGLALESAANYADGTGPLARFGSPTGTAVDAAGNVFVADTAGHCIRKITPAGVVTTLAGSPGVAGSADGMGTAARFSNPTGLALDLTGGLFVADTNNHTIRHITPAGETSTFAGTAGGYGWQDGQGAAAQFWYPRGVAFDPAASCVYVTSAGTVRKITLSGQTSTLAGLNSESGYVDANGTSARFSIPYGITVGAGGNVYVSEAPDGPTIARIRKITPAGDVTTVAGAEHGYADGSGATARFHNPYGLAADLSGNLFVTDSYNQTVRKVTPQGAVTTVAGLADAPGSTDGVGRDVRFYFPQGIAVDPNGTLYVTSGTTVRKGQLGTGPVLTQQPQSQSVTSGSNVTFSVTAGGNPAPTYQWSLNGAALSGATGSSLTLSAVRSSDGGVYAVTVTNALGSVTSSNATLTVTTPTTPPPSGGGSGSSGGGGGGGAPSAWFYLAATLAVVARYGHRRAGCGLPAQ